MTDLAVIGAGPAGLAAAVAAAAEGVRVALVDSAADVGGSSTGSPRPHSVPVARRPCTISGELGSGCGTVWPTVTSGF